MPLFAGKRERDSDLYLVHLVKYGLTDPFCSEVVPFTVKHLFRMFCQDEIIKFLERGVVDIKNGEVVLP